MPRAKRYRGVVYSNSRWGGKKQHVLRFYKKNGSVIPICSDTMDLFAKEVKKRIKDNYQCIVVFEGGTGSGKSSAAIRLAKTLDPNWSITDNYIYGLEDLQRKLDKADKGDKVSPISLFDEAIVSLNSRNANRAQDREMMILFNTMRSLGWITLLCVPSIFDLNKALRTSHVDYKLRCPDKAPLRGYDRRGFLEFSVAKRNEFSRTGEPYWYLFSCGIFEPLKLEWDEEYQKLKREKQELLLNKFIEREME